jgi:hypothetical protein
MAEDPSTTPTETPPPAGDPVAPAPSPTDPPKTFTQEEMDRHAIRRAAEAKRAASKDLADQLGVSVDEAKKIIEGHRAKAEAEKTEVERAKEAESAAKAEADQAKQEAAKERFETRVYRKLSAAGVGAGMEDEAAEKQIARARRLLDVTLEATDEEIAGQIAEIKNDVPGLFTAKTEGGQTAPSGVTNGRPPAGGQGTQSAMDRGRERYRSGRPDPSKQTDPFTGAIRRAG